MSNFFCIIFILSGFSFPFLCVFAFISFIRNKTLGSWKKRLLGLLAIMLISFVLLAITMCSGEKKEISRIEPTCTSEGTITYECIECGEITTETIDKLNHSLEEVSITEPTNEKSGVIIEKCTVCGTSLQTILEPLKPEESEVTQTPESSPTPKPTPEPTIQSEPSPTPKPTPESTSQPEQEQQIDIENLPVYSLEYLFAYTDKNDININFEKNINKINKYIQREGTPTFLEYDEYDDVIRYGATINETQYIYYGEMDDNRPDGWGCIFKIVSAEEYNDDGVVRLDIRDYTSAKSSKDLYPVIVYSGQFKNGYYDGYGWLFDSPLTYLDDAEYGWHEVEKGRYYQQVSDDISYNILESCNPLEYIGEFKKGEFNGNGAEFAYLIQYIDPEMSSDEVIEIFGLDCRKELSIAVGEFKDGFRHGKIKTYLYGKLSYSGNMRYSERDGQGIQYYGNSTQVEYNGNFSVDKYWGKGTLYDTEGNVIYSGEWVDGDFAK